MTNGERVLHREHEVADGAALGALTADLEAADAIAVDLETNSMHAYRGRLCFVQLATADDIWIVDTLAEGVDAAALAPAFLEASRRKVFHDAQGDLRVLAGVGLRIRNLFDTQRAAMLLGLPRIGLGDLVESRFGVKLSKEHQTADFGRRPVPDELRSYVADDVRYLLPLAEQLEEEARELDILEEVQLEFDRIAEECAEPEALPRPKIPQAARDALGLAIADAADRLRNREAAARDQPVGRVLANAAVGEIALRRPATTKELARIPGVKGSFTRAAGVELLAEIARLRARAERGELPAPPAPPRRDPLRRSREEKLKAWRAEAAKARGVVPSVVLPTAVSERLAAKPPEDLDELARVPWLGEKRVRLYGRAILDVLRAAG
ncbi:MAG TPA: HRDC domain-containing protein [Vulgatibacter sp.]|nr:HRDC domain-containing protein [Vulgatibacter sp.]